MERTHPAIVEWTRLTRAQSRCRIAAIRGWHPDWTEKRIKQRLYELAELRGLARERAYRRCDRKREAEEAEERYTKTRRSSRKRP